MKFIPIKDEDIVKAIKKSLKKNREIYEAIASLDVKLAIQKSIKKNIETLHILAKK